MYNLNEQNTWKSGKYNAHFNLNWKRGVNNRLKMESKKIGHNSHIYTS